MAKEARKPPFANNPSSSSSSSSSSTPATPTSAFLWIIPAIAFGLFISKLFPSPSAGCDFGPAYNSTQLYTLQKASNGDSVFKIAVVTDLDQSSKHATKKNTWISYFKTGDLKIAKDLSAATVHWQSDEETIVLSSQISAGGRGMELSDLAVFDGNLISCDDRIGLVYKIENDYKDVIPWIFLTDGPGNVTKGLKAEWMTVKDNHLWVGGLGKEWTTTEGVFVNYHPMYVKRIGHNGDIQHIDWIENFKKLRRALGIEWPGYMIHEAVQWSEIHRKWFFMPRRASHEPYTEATDEYAGTDLLLIADENFDHIEVKHIGSKGTGYRGFAAFSFVPGFSDNLIAAVKSEEKDGIPVASYLTTSKIDIMTGGNREPSDEAFARFKQNHPRRQVITTSNGAPIGNKSTVMTVGPRGPMLMQDVVYMDEMAHFDRERIPERVVHAKGGGAHGYFEVTHDISKYSKAAIFSEIGKRTPMFIRFSTVGGENGSADTARDPRGFAMKFYTEEGNWDLVGNNTPIFFIRDPILFPNFIHTQKRHPQTHLKDPNMIWDFWTLRPESIHQVMFLFSDRGTPDGYRHMNGYGSHTFKLVNKNGEAVYCKFHAKTAQKIKNLPVAEADRLAGADPDYSIRDLFNSIEKGDYPQWDFFIQVMTFDQAEKAKVNPFDVTKVWPHGEYPLIPVGKFVLNRNPTNYFAEVEQAAFCPAHVVPGIEFSPDKMLQGRLFSYTDTHFHRLGPNYIQLPINCPYRAKAHNTQRDGTMALGDNHGDYPNHFPNSFNGYVERPDAKESVWHTAGDVNRHDAFEDDNYSQPRDFWLKVLDDGARQRLVDNIVGMVKNCYPDIQERVVEVYGRVHPDFKKKLSEGLNKAKHQAHM